jgi:PAS domain S-box-containing protein
LLHLENCVSTLTQSTSRPNAAAAFLITLAFVAASVAALFVLWPFLFGVQPEINIHDLKRLRIGNPAVLSGVVTFSDDETRRFYLQDDTGALRIQLRNQDPLPERGDRVTISGTLDSEYVASLGMKSVQFAALKVKTTGKELLPAAERRGIVSLFFDTAMSEFVRVETEGIVRAVSKQGDRLLMEVGQDGYTMPVVVLDAADAQPDYLLDARIVLSGVVSHDYEKIPLVRTTRIEDFPPRMAVASLKDLKILSPAPEQSAHVQSAHMLIVDPEWVARGHRVRVQGKVVNVDSADLLLIENGGIVVPVETDDAKRFKAGDTVEAIGWPTRRRFTITLQRAEVAAIATLRSYEKPIKPLPLITSIAQIRRMSPEEAARAYPVRLTAVLTSVNVQRDCYFLQMGHDGIYVDASGQNVEELRVGQQVSVTGLTSAGGFAPVLIHPHLSILGDAPLPSPTELDPELAPSGIYDAAWTELEGLVRPIRSVDGYQTFNLITSLGAVRTTVVNSKDALGLEKLVDARVRLAGVFSTAFTNEGVLTGYRLFVDSENDIRVVKPAPADPTTVEATPVKNLLRFSGSTPRARRAHVRGVVTFNDSGSLYLEDESGSVHVRTPFSDARPGEIVDAVGYPTPSEHGPMLADATIHLTGKQATLEPRLVTPEEILNGNLDSRLVSIDARVLSQVDGTTHQTLVLQSGYVTFNAELRDGTPLQRLSEGSLVTIAGVSVVQRQQMSYRDARAVPTSFRILLRSAEDIRLVNAAPWWHLRQAWPALAVLTLSICFAMLWVFILRKRVRTQTRELDSQRTFLRQIIDMCPNFIFVKDRAGRFTLANRALAEAYQRAPEEMLGKTDSEVGVIDKEAHGYFLDDMQVMESRQEKIVGEESRTDLSGRKLWMHTVRRPLIGPDGAATHVLGISNDITLHKQAEATLHKAREAAEAANRAKSEFLANMSHEIRTPLNGIIGMSELCLDTDLSGEQREYLETVKLSADGLLAVINDILDFSKIEAGKLELDPAEFDIRETLETTLKTLALRAHQKGLELTCDLSPDVPQLLKGDANRLRQVILNLVGNAIKFTERGEVALRAQLRVRDGGHCVLHFTVMDTGIGIAANRQEHIFNPFAQADSSTTRQYGGTGLGLTISNRLATMMEGRMWVDSEPGKGSQFHFTVRFELIEGPRLCDTSMPPRGLENVRVLIVDDNQTSGRVVSQALHHWKMRPLVAASAPEALAMLERASREQDPCRLIIADLNMPHEDGLSLIDNIRRYPALNTPAIMLLTSSGQRQDAVRCRAAGVESYLIKPVRLSELRESVLRTLSLAIPSQTCVTTPKSERAPAAGLNILLAEDNVVNQLLMQRLLHKRGHRVTIADTGKAVLAALQRDTFDLVFMDVQMPELDGFETTAEIRRIEAASGEHLAIVALTAHAMTGDRERCLASGMDGYLTKPISPKELDDALKSYGTQDAAAVDSLGRSA